jgi:hypothetical protein
MTQDGSGVVSRCAEKGDLIRVLLDCSVPIITQREGANYVVVDDTYVYRMMQGGTMDEFEKGRLHIRNLTFE